MNECIRSVMRNNPQSDKEVSVKMAFACGAISMNSTNCQRTGPSHMLPEYKAWPLKAAEMTQKLKALAAFGEGLGSVPSTYFRESTTVYNCSAKGSNVHFWTPQIPAFTYTSEHIHAYWYT